MKEKIFDNIQVAFAIRSPLTGKIFHVTTKFDDAVYLSGLIENDKKQTEIVVVPLIVNYGDIPFKSSGL